MNYFINESQAQSHACVIWMHGLGADANDMKGLADELTIDLPLRHVFINAPIRPVTLNAGMAMPAWYDIVGVNLTDREDTEGIKKSELMIKKIIEEQISNGFSHQQIFLAGFSQGGAMAMYTALHIPARLGGVIALSAYLPLANHTQTLLDNSTPFFMGSGQFDSLVLPQWTELSKNILFNKGYKNITYRTYPMDHSICLEEVKDFSSWLIKSILGDS